MQEAGYTERQREYREVYLRSAHWAATRKAALERAGRRCQVCNGADQLDVHHRTYERLGAEEPSDLTVLCRRCHALFHDSGKVVQPKKRKGKKSKRKKEREAISRQFSKDTLRIVYSDGTEEFVCRKAWARQKKEKARLAKEAAANRPVPAPQPWEPRASRRAA